MAYKWAQNTRLRAGAYSHTCRGFKPFSVASNSAGPNFTHAFTFIAEFQTKKTSKEKDALG